MHMDLGLLDPFSGKHRVPHRRFFLKKRVVFFPVFLPSVIWVTESSSEKTS